MKKILKYISFFLLICSVFLWLFTSLSCRTEDKEEDELIDINNNNSSNLTSGRVDEDDFTVFERYGPDGKTMYHSFIIPSSWKTTKEGSAFLGQESFTNNEGEKYCLVSFTDIKNIEKLGIEKFSKAEKVFIKAIDALTGLWEKSGFILSNESKTKGEFILDGEKIQAYLVEKEEYFDVNKLFTNIGQKEEKQKSLLYVIFIVYEEKYIGYYVLIDHSFDKEDNSIIIDKFLKSLNINMILTNFS